MSQNNIIQFVTLEQRKNGSCTKMKLMVRELLLSKLLCGLIACLELLIEAQEYITQNSCLL